jgi:hypothetical protein
VTVGKPDAPAALLMDSCSVHLVVETIRLPTDKNVKVLTFPPHTSNSFQRLHLVSFDVFTQVKRHFSKDSTFPMMQDHARRMFRAFESAAVSFSIRAHSSMQGSGM